jgi:hypothetical protein
MAKGPMYVKDFDFSAKPCNYSHGGSAKAGQAVQMAKSNAVSKSLVGQKPTKMASGGYYAKGGMKEPATGEKYPSRSSMMKRESLETPRMQKDEVIQSRTVKAPMRRQMPVASSAPMIQAGGMKKGGFVKGGTGMVKTEGTLGIKGNKNPGERNGKPTTATKTGNVPFKSGGTVKKYANGGPATQTGALNQMAQQQRQVPQPTQTMLAGSQPMPPGMQQGQQPSQQQMQQIQAARPGTPMPGQQGPVGFGQAAMGGGMAQQQQMAAAMAAFNASRAGQGMPGGQQASQGQLFGQMSPQAQQQAMSQMPPEMAALARQNMGMSDYMRATNNNGMGQGPMGVPPQSLGGTPLPAQQMPPQQQYSPFQQGQSTQMGQALPQQASQMPFNARLNAMQGTPQQAPMGMGMGQFGQQAPQMPQNARLNAMRGRP